MEDSTSASFMAETEAPPPSPVTDGSTEVVRALGLLPAVLQCVKQSEPQDGTQQIRDMGSMGADDSSHRSRSKKALTGSWTVLHLVMNEALPGPRKAAPGAGLSVSWGRSPDGYFVQRGQPGEVGMHQTDGLEEAAVLGCGHLWQVGFQKRTQKS